MNQETEKNSLPLALKIAALEQARDAVDTRISERAEAVEKLARMIADATTAQNAATAALLETKLTGVDTTLANSIETHAKALELQAKEYERRFGILDRGLERLERSSVSNEVFGEVERQRRDDTYSLRGWQGKVNSDLDIQKGRNSERQSLIALALSILALMATIVGLFLAYGHRVI